MIGGSLSASTTESLHTQAFLQGAFILAQARFDGAPTKEEETP
jgi:hypothetical protein